MVDVVFLWVDGGDPSFIAERRRIRAAIMPQDERIDDADGRYRDNGELRYALRAAWKNLPFARRFIIVTNGQRPSFIDFSHPRIKLVAHREFFAPDAALPTFHATGIQTQLQNIPGLSESYVIVDDDTFVGKPVDPNELLWSDGLGRFFLGAPITKPQGAHNPFRASLVNTESLLNATYGHCRRRQTAHVPHARSRNAFRRLLEKWPREMAEQMQRRFRSSADLFVHVLYAYFVLHEIRGLRDADDLRAMVERGVRFNNSAIGPTIQIGSSGEPWRDRLRALEANPPMFFTLNDHFGAKPSEDDIATLHAFLERQFPEPCPFET